MTDSRNGESGEQGLWYLRLLAVVIALGVWLYAAYMPRVQELLVPRVEWGVDTEVSYSVPEGSKLVVLNAQQRIRVQLRGREEQQRAVENSGGIGVQIPFEEGTSAGDRQVAILPEYVRLPDDSIEVVSITPNRLELILDIEETRQVRAVPIWRGEAGGALPVPKSYRVTPETIEIQGPRSILDQEDRIAIPVDLEGRIYTFQRVLPVPPPADSHLRVIQPRTVTVWVELEPPPEPDALDLESNGGS